METYLAAAYWRARKETLEDCVARVSVFLKQLATAGEEFTGWRERGRSKKDALNRKVIGAEQSDDLKALLEKGRNRYDIPPRGIIEELGYSLSLWNGRSSESESLSLRIHCGDYSNAVLNAVTLSPLLGFDHTSKENVLKLSGYFIESWQPDFFILTGDTRLAEETEKARALNKQRDPFLDIALYLSSELEAVFSPSNYGSTEQLRSGRIFLNV